MDKIHINGISCQAHVGVPLQERENPQQIVVDLVLSLDLEAAVKSDDVESTVDYQEIVEKVEKAVAEKQFRLLEALAGYLCHTLLTDTRIKSVQVTLRKFPEVLREKVSYVEVEITRTNY